MPTECNPAWFEFPRLEGRAVVASFDGGQITSEAGALLRGATNKVIGLTRRLPESDPGPSKSLQQNPLDRHDPPPPTGEQAIMRQIR